MKWPQYGGQQKLVIIINLILLCFSTTDFIYYNLLDVCTHLFFNAPRLEIRRPAIDNKGRLTGRYHWPGKREVSEDGKGAGQGRRKCQKKGKGLSPK